MSRLVSNRGLGLGLLGHRGHHHAHGRSLKEHLHKLLGGRHHRRREMLLLRSHHGCPLRRRHHGCALRLRHHRSTLLWRGPGLLRRHPKPGRALRGRGSRHVLGPLGHHREPGIALRGRQRNHGCALLRRRHRKKPESASVRLRRGHRGLMLGCGNIHHNGGEPLGVRVGHLSSGPASVVSDGGSARRRRLGFS